ncbi:hypothetical protein ASD79_15690 [Caulobacter sp. Root655]|uniref:hypothetical protein n=1 Tax=Caulobacter sp. Root655 TaxID=1736578 RepID=UPI0006F97F84|nr:hypothetical protein [Caulobacter sp. Root655]KRA57758.1 hypothetical protein ASD79_15690 [Caulobacter sp. Root655]
MKPLVRVLIVTDRFDGGFLHWTSHEPNREFHLGEFVDVLLNTSWLGFKIEVTKAHRDAPEPGGEAAMKATTGADVVGFRFDQGFTVNGVARVLADYDMVLLFAITRGAEDIDPALAPQAEAIAQYMEKGGGFFATGDHENLGAEVGRIIPRVRSLRRWWPSFDPKGHPPAPDGQGVNRFDTTRPGPDHVVQFEDQSDEIAQEIHPAWYSGGIKISGGYLAKSRYPHPLLCSPAGVIKYLPDHMHEGHCEVPDNFATLTYKLAGATVAEFPTDGDPDLVPEVIATADVLGGHVTLAIAPGTFDDPDIVAARSFGVIAAWDGHRVKRGRVVVDSTWHHFFNINLTGDMTLKGLGGFPQTDQRLFGFYIPDGNGGRKASPHYEAIKAYYRNIIYWLIPAKRHHVVWWNALLDIAAFPRLKEELPHFGGGVDPGKIGDTLEKGGAGFDFERCYYWGGLADQYLALARGACGRLIIRDFLYKPKIPWWEWIQETYDPWERAPIDRRPEFERFAVLGALGLTPRPEVLLQAGLGAALLMAGAAGDGRAPGLAAKTVDALDTAWTQSLDRLTEQYEARLEEGLRLAAGFKDALHRRPAAKPTTKPTAKPTTKR